MGGKNSRITSPYGKSSRKSVKEELNLGAIPARVDKVNISGLDRTHDDYVQRAANRLFQTTNFQDMILECNNTRQYLAELGIYKDVHVYIDVSKGEKATPNGYDISFKGVELSRLVGSIGTEIDQDEGFLTAELAAPNIWGRGERLTLQGKYSNFKTADVILKLTKPFYHTAWGDLKPETSFSIFRHANAVPVSAYKTQNLGILTDFSFFSLKPIELSHSFQYEMSFRELFAAHKQAPFFIRENCGPRMASLIRYIIAYDQRDSIVFPTHGIYSKLTGELSGLGGNIHYKMLSNHSEFNVPLFAGIVAQLCFRIGYLFTSEKDQQIPLSSLFTLGGPSSLRGFKYGGASPYIDGCVAGANSFWATGLHLWTPMPFSNYLGRLSNNFRMHFFYNLGTCNSFNTEKLRSAAGIGIAYRIGERARIEFNYCQPIDKQSGDHVVKGFQFGIGYEFI